MKWPAYMGEVKYPCDDRAALRAALSELLGIPGPAMPWVPACELIVNKAAKDKLNNTFLPCSI